MEREVLVNGQYFIVWNRGNAWTFNEEKHILSKGFWVVGYS